ncbi:MAG: 50S ribosomal protein L24 [bacterium]
MNRLKKGDMVKIISGKDKGKEGKILMINPSKDQITVEGINLVSKCKKESKDSKGGIFQVPAPIPSSKLMLIIKSKPSKVKYVLHKGKKIREAKGQVK